MNDDELKKKLECLEKRSDFSYLMEWTTKNPYWIVFVLIPLLVVMLLIKFHGDVGAIFPSIDGKEVREQYALLGDTLGGLLNPLLTFVSLIFLIMTLRQNQQVLKVNSEELELSRVELGRSANALESQLAQSELQSRVTLLLELLKAIQTEISALDKSEHSMQTIDEVLRSPNFKAKNVSGAVLDKPAELDRSALSENLRLFVNDSKSNHLMSLIDAACSLASDASSESHREKLVSLLPLYIHRSVLALFFFKKSLSEVIDPSSLPVFKGALSGQYVSDLIESYLCNDLYWKCLSLREKFEDYAIPDSIDDAIDELNLNRMQIDEAYAKAEVFSGVLRMLGVDSDFSRNLSSFVYQLYFYQVESDLY